MPADLVLRSPWNLWARGVVRIQPYLTAADDVRDDVEDCRMKEEVEATSAMKLRAEAFWRELEAVAEEGQHAGGKRRVRALFFCLGMDHLDKDLLAWARVGT